MKSTELYKKTFRFTLMRMVSGLTSVLAVVLLPLLAYLVTGSLEDGTRVLVCLGAFIAGCVAAWLVGHFWGYIYRSGQIYVTAVSVKEDAIPENAYEQGKAAVKSRFGTVAVFFAIEKIIRLIVNQITNTVTRVTGKLGGSNSSGSNAAGIVGAVISMVISAMLQFLCACCMGWVFLHPGENAWRCACDGAIVYFKNWKDLLKNTGKVILIGLLSLALIGGLLFGCTHALLHEAPLMRDVTREITEFAGSLNAEGAGQEGEDSVSLPVLPAETWAYIFEVLIALIVWGVLHSALVDPYVMISVMKRYILAGLANPPEKERALDEKLAKLSKSYKKALTAPGA